MMAPAGSTLKSTPDAAGARAEAGGFVVALQAPAVDPVMSALIAKLPPPGSLWPERKRAAWMQLVWLTFEVIYQGDGELTELPAFLKASAPGTLPVVAGTAAPPAPAPLKPNASPFALLVDRDGYARRGDGTRINANEVGSGVLYDERGESGDLGAIVWADGSLGVPPGLQLDISPAF